ncbi:MAG: LapA family protein [Vagococcus sp.]
MKNTSKLFFVLILSFIVVLFSVINAQQIEVNFVFAKVSLPLVVIIIGAVLIGALIVFTVMTGSIWKKNKELKQIKNELQETKLHINERVEGELDTQVGSLEERLKEKELELSDLRHQMVNQMMTDKDDVPVD